MLFAKVILCIAGITLFAIGLLYVVRKLVKDSSDCDSTPSPELLLLPCSSMAFGAALFLAGIFFERFSAVVSGW